MFLSPTGVVDAWPALAKRQQLHFGAKQGRLLAAGLGNLGTQMLRCRQVASLGMTILEVGSRNNVPIPKLRRRSPIINYISEQSKTCYWQLGQATPVSGIMYLGSDSHVATSPVFVNSQILERSAALSEHIWRYLKIHALLSPAQSAHERGKSVPQCRLLTAGLGNLGTWA